MNHTANIFSFFIFFIFLFFNIFVDLKKNTVHTKLEYEFSVKLFKWIFCDKSIKKWCREFNSSLHHGILEPEVHTTYRSTGMRSSQFVLTTRFSSAPIHLNRSF